MEFSDEIPAIQFSFLFTIASKNTFFFVCSFYSSITLYHY